VAFEYVPTSSWETTLEKLGRGEIDFVTGFANLRERPVEALYTRSYTAFPLATIMRNDGPFFTSLEQIERRGLVVAVPAGYAPTIYIERNYPGIPLLRTGSSVEALKHVSEGSADVAVENLGVAAHLIRENGLLNLKITGPTRHHFDPAFGVAPEHPELHSILDKALASVTRREMLEIHQKWVLVEISGLWGWQRVVLLCGLILAVAALLVGLIFSSNRRLAAELKKRREVEESLRQSEGRFRHLFERMDQAYFLTRTDGKIQFVNETAVEVLGIGSRPVVERLSLLTFLKRPSDLEEIVAALRADKKIRDRAVTFVRADGSTYPSRCQIRLLPGSGERADDDGIEWLARGAE
jgi:PAS domain S-box-containing protein